MTDDELIAALRDLGDRAAYEPHMHHAAADRIEALVKERDRQYYESVSRIYQQALTEARAERLEKALRELVTCVDDGCFCSEMKMATAIDDARAALKGADHE